MRVSGRRKGERRGTSPQLLAKKDLCLVSASKTSGGVGISYNLTGNWWLTSRPSTANLPASACLSRRISSTISTFYTQPRRPDQVLGQTRLLSGMESAFLSVSFAEVSSRVQYMGPKGGNRHEEDCSGIAVGCGVGGACLGGYGYDGQLCTCRIPCCGF